MDNISSNSLYGFTVVCDESNNTPDSIDQNWLCVDIDIKPINTNSSNFTKGLSKRFMLSHFLHMSSTEIDYIMRKMEDDDVLVNMSSTREYELTPNGLGVKKPFVPATDPQISEEELKRRAVLAYDKTKKSLGE